MRYSIFTLNTHYTKIRIQQIQNDFKCLYELKYRRKICYRTFSNTVGQKFNNFTHNEQSKKKLCISKVQLSKHSNIQNFSSVVLFALHITIFQNENLFELFDKTMKKISIINYERSGK